MNKKDVKENVDYVVFGFTLSRMDSNEKLKSLQEKISKEDEFIVKKNGTPKITYYYGFIGKIGTIIEHNMFIGLKKGDSLVIERPDHLEEYRVVPLITERKWGQKR